MVYRSINNIKNFTEEDATVFPDVTSDKWYYSHVKIAKKAGVGKVIYHSHGAGIDGIYKILHNLSKPQLNKWCDVKYACSVMAGEFMYKGEFKLLNNAINLEKFE